MYRRSRLFPLLAVVLSLLVALAACGDDDAASDSGSGDAAPPSDDSTGDTAEADGDDAFPVTIAHKYGETTVDEEPERVVSVGYTDQDFVLALDVVPVGIRDWYGDQPFAVWPWAQDALGDAEPEVLSSEALNFEQIAGLRPDLIVGVSSGMTDEDYETLAAIAPTLPQSGDYVDYGMPWQEGVRMIASALGRSELGESVIGDVDDRLASIREEHPEFVGTEALVGFAQATDEVGAYASEDSRSRVLTDLGFVIPPDVDELAGDAFYASFSAERIDRLDRDLLVWIAATDEVIAQIEASPLRNQLRVVEEGREVFLTALQGAAAGFSSPLSLPYFLDTFVPQAAAAVDGDPATEVPDAA